MRKIPPGVSDGKRSPNCYLKKEIFFLPFYVYRAVYTGGREILIMVDGIKGKTVKIEATLLELGKKAEEGWMSELSEKEAREIAFQEARFPVSIFFKKRLQSLEFVDKLLYPFIVYYRKKGEGYNIDVYDAITGKKENFFAREMIISILIKGSAGFADQ